MFFTSTALVKTRNFQKYLQNPIPRLLLSCVLFSLNICVCPQNGGEGILAFQAELRPFGSLEMPIFCIPPPGSSVFSQS